VGENDERTVVISRELTGQGSPHVHAVLARIPSARIACTPMQRSAKSRRTIVIVLIACLLRALLPIEGAMSTDSSTPASGTRSLTASDFPCAGHVCGCRTREHCLAACCCFPVRGGAARAADSVALPSVALLSVVPSSVARASAASGERADHAAFVQALKCAGGAPRSVAAGFTILSTEPPESATLSLGDGERADASVVVETLSGMRPSPSTPPPRRRDARV
jgi:hypothetical protein